MNSRDTGSRRASAAGSRPGHDAPLQDWNKEHPAQLKDAAHYPIWAGVGAGLADSNETETRRLPSLNCDPTARMPRMCAAGLIAAGLPHDEVIAVHHGCAAAEAEDGEDIG